MCRLQSGVAPATPMLYSRLKFIVQEAPLEKISFCVGWAPTGVPNPDDWGGSLDDWVGPCQPS